MIVVMVRIPVGSAEEGERIEGRFKDGIELVDDQPGFMGFELLKGEHEYISVTRWASRGDLENWTRSQAHAQAHATPALRVPEAAQTGGHPQGMGGEPKAASGSTASSASSTLVYEVVIPEGER